MKIIDNLKEFFTKIFANNKQKLIAGSLKLDNTNSDKNKYNFNNLLKGNVVADDENFLNNFENLTESSIDKIETLYFPEEGIGNQSLITK